MVGLPGLLRTLRPAARHAASRGLAGCSGPIPALTLTDDPTPGVKILTLNRPESLNAMSVEMGDAMQEAVEKLKCDPGLRAVVVTGSGRAFSAGGDMKFLGQRRDSGDPTGNMHAMRGFYARFLCIRQVPVPVVACINGPAIGAGMSFAMGADIRVTHDKAKLGFNFVALGLHPGMGCTHTVASAASGQAASRMLLTGDLVSGEEALKLGLVCASHADAGAAMEDAVGIARRIAAQSPVAVRATVRTLRNAADAGFEQALQREADAQAQSYASEDCAPRPHPPITAFN